MTAEELIAELQKLDPDTVILTRKFLTLVPAVLVQIAGTEYGLKPIGRKKAAIVPEE